MPLERLPGGRALQEVFREGASFPGTLVVLHVRRGEPGRSRAAVAAGRRIGKAHDRNRLKRLLREALRAAADLVPDGVDLVLVARPALIEASFAALCEDVRRVLTAVASSGWEGASGAKSGHNAH